jgi:hypothetical protein
MLKILANKKKTFSVPRRKKKKKKIKSHEGLKA